MAVPADQSLQDREPVGLADRIDAALVRLDGLRDRPVVSVAAAVAIAAVVGAGWWFGRPSTTEPIDAAIPLAATSTAPADTPATVAPGAAVAGDGAGGQEQPDTLIVHVAGAVARPGIVELEPGDRVVDAVTAAGGPVEGADVHQLNLAAPVSDGLQIRVPVEGEVVASPVGVPAAALPGSGDGGGPIEVNRAPAPEL
jgi:competence protein ComEA